jgi:hypothetical protein
VRWTGRDGSIDRPSISFPGNLLHLLSFMSIIPIRGNNSSFSFAEQA